jgi:hypothetical protein
MSGQSSEMIDHGEKVQPENGHMQEPPPAPAAADLPPGDYAIAEIMGHSTMIGRYTEVERFGTKMLSLEPIWENKLLPAVFVGGASLYRFTPCSRETAFDRQPKHRYQLPPAVAATLPPEQPAALSAPDELGDSFEHEDQDEADGAMADDLDF